VTTLRRVIRRTLFARCRRSNVSRGRAQLPDADRERERADEGRPASMRPGITHRPSSRPLVLGFVMLAVLIAGVGYVV
jgi:hypothetical protein